MEITRIEPAQTDEWFAKMHKLLDLYSEKSDESTALGLAGAKVATEIIAEDAGLSVEIAPTEGDKNTPKAFRHN